MFLNIANDFSRETTPTPFLTCKGCTNFHAPLTEEKVRSKSLRVKIYRTIYIKAKNFLHKWKDSLHKKIRPLSPNISEIIRDRHLIVKIKLFKIMTLII